MDFSYLQQSTFSLVSFVFIVSLMVGSFLNVVIYRLPLMLEKKWLVQSQEILGFPIENDQEFNLCLPRSHCPNCQAVITWFQNIPIISYLLLRGRCGGCQIKIAWRYPMVELLTAVSSTFVAWRVGYAEQLPFMLILTWVLITLSFIDFDHLLLPDVIVIPTMWLGLAISIDKVIVDSENSITGAIAGYLSLWLIYYFYKIVTNKQGMGYGDFKLLALFGAWFGWQVLPIIVFISAFLTLFFSICLVVFKKQEWSKPVPFGPYLAIAGWSVMLYGDDFIKWYSEMFFRFLGLQPILPPTLFFNF
jgi:leader peptidase (prepilin peptidase)/N-methyltransferase